MKRIDLKSLLVGMAIGAIGISTMTVGFAAGMIKQTEVSDTKVMFFDNEVKFEKPLVTVLAEGETEGTIYVPLVEFSEFMNFTVIEKPDEKLIQLDMSAYTNHTVNKVDNQVVNEGTATTMVTDIPFPLSSTDINEQALEIITKTGNWSYLKSYLPRISEETLVRVVEIYNSKHMNKSEHKDAKLILESLKK